MAPWKPILAFRLSVFWVDTPWVVPEEVAFIQFASLNPRPDIGGLVPGSQSRLAEILIPCWSLQRSLALDVSIVVPTRTYLPPLSAEDNILEHI